VPLHYAEIIAVGSELLTPSRVDTNSLFITERLNEIGIDVRTKMVVGDNLRELSQLVRQALERADVVVLTGGLGPTDDDLTRQAVAEVLGLPLEEDAGIVAAIRERFAARGLDMPEINRRQALVPRGGVPLPNSRGTAPGIWIERGDRILLMLPGPPRELQPMLSRVIDDRLAARAGGRRLYRRVLRVTGRTESHVEEAAQPVYSRWLERDVPIDTTILTAPGQIELHLTVRAGTDDEGRRILDDATAELSAVLRPYSFSTDGRTMEQIVAGLLTERRLQLAIGESCTGGLIASRLTDVPGSSDFLELAVVAYGNRAKVSLLGVPPELISEHGAVSEPVALAMAHGARRAAKADIGVGVTGIAGPGGGTDRKPVGTVAFAVVGPGDAERVRTALFPGGRLQVKFHASQAALDAVRRVLLESEAASSQG
jgi:nicotinamide-nucleotide amidase